MESSASFALVMMRFPEHRKSIEKLFVQSESFQSLCEDYQDCLGALENCSRCAGEQMHPFQKELQELKEDLEEEIIWYVQNKE